MAVIGRQSMLEYFACQLAMEGSGAVPLTELVLQMFRQADLALLRLGVALNSYDGPDLRLLDAQQVEQLRTRVR